MKHLIFYSALITASILVTWGLGWFISQDASWHLVDRGARAVFLLFSVFTYALLGLATIGIQVRWDV